MDVPREQTKSYGIAAVKAEKDGLAEITGLVEKPKPEEAPSTLAVIGRYVLLPEVFDHLDKHETRRRRRDPAHRRHGQDDRPPAVPRAALSPAGATTAATGWASSRPTSPWRSTATTLSRPETLARCSAGC